MGGPDLVILNFAGSEVGGTVTYTMDVHNLGTVDALSVQVDLYYDLAVAPTVMQPGDDTTTIPTIPADLRFASLIFGFARPGTSDRCRRQRSASAAATASCLIGLENWNHDLGLRSRQVMART